MHKGEINGVKTNLWQESDFTFSEGFPHNEKNNFLKKNVCVCVFFFKSFSVLL